MRLTDAFRVFDVVYVRTTSGPANTTDVLSTYIYRQMFTVFDFFRRCCGGCDACTHHSLLLCGSRDAAAQPCDRRLSWPSPHTAQRLWSDAGTYAFLIVVAILVLVPI